ncbi:hypothetical protein NO1_2242, partial [Candidatus Termititenax aidoneus]
MQAKTIAEQSAEIRVRLAEDVGSRHIGILGNLQEAQLILSADYGQDNLRQIEAVLGLLRETAQLLENNELVAILPNYLVLPANLQGFVATDADGTRKFKLTAANLQPFIQELTADKETIVSGLVGAVDLQPIAQEFLSARTYRETRAEQINGRSAAYAESNNINYRAILTDLSELEEKSVLHNYLYEALGDNYTLATDSCTQWFAKRLRGLVLNSYEKELDRLIDERKSQLLGTQTLTADKGEYKVAIDNLLRLYGQLITLEHDQASSFYNPQWPENYWLLSAQNFIDSTTANPVLKRYFKA